jgi:hypothetical protein
MYYSQRCYITCRYAVNTLIASLAHDIIPEGYTGDECNDIYRQRRGRILCVASAVWSFGVGGCVRQSSSSIPGGSSGVDIEEPRVTAPCLLMCAPAAGRSQGGQACMHVGVAPTGLAFFYSCCFRLSHACYPARPGDNANSLLSP